MALKLSIYRDQILFLSHKKLYIIEALWCLSQETHTWLATGSSEPEFSVKSQAWNSWHKKLVTQFSSMITAVLTSSWQRLTQLFNHSVILHLSQPDSHVTARLGSRFLFWHEIPRHPLQTSIWMGGQAPQIQTQCAQPTFSSSLAAYSLSHLPSLLSYLFSYIGIIHDPQNRCNTCK